MTLRDIVKKYLEDNGFDGLFCPDECACALDDLFPCDEPHDDCESGYKVPCRCAEGCDFDIAAEKDPAKESKCQRS